MCNSFCIKKCLNFNMKRIIFVLLAILLFQISSFAEEIHFNNDVYTLRYSAIAPQTEG